MDDLNTQTRTVGLELTQIEHECKATIVCRYVYLTGQSVLHTVVSLVLVVGAAIEHWPQKTSASLVSLLAKWLCVQPHESVPSEHRDLQRQEACGVPQSLEDW